MQIGGPTGAFVVIVYGIVQKYGVDGLMVATLMGGLILIAFGLARLGGAIKFIPFPVVTGFTSALAAIIALSQVRNALGLRMQAVPAEVVEKLAAYVQHLGSTNGYAIAIAIVTVTVLITIAWPKVSPRIPAPFVALIVTTVAVHVASLPVETVGSRFGVIEAGFPRFSLPAVSLATVRELFGPALAIAALAGIESLLSAVVSDGMIGGRHRSNMELIAQGTANVASAVFGGMPATGAIARTATNVKSGGRTPVAGIVHAVTLLAITLAFGRWAALIPMATLAGILLVVAYHNERVADVQARAMDSTAMHALRDLVRRTKRDGTTVIFSGVHSQPLVALARSELLDEIGKSQLVGNIDAALEAARKRIAPPRPAD